MTLIDGDRIITAQLYNDEYEEFTEEKMSIIDYINAYTDEGVTETDVIEQTRWIPVSERLPDKNGRYLVTVKQGYITFGEWVDEAKNWANVIAWMPLPKPYEPQESEDNEVENDNKIQ